MPVARSIDKRIRDKEPICYMVLRAGFEPATYGCYRLTGSELSVNTDITR